MEQKRKDLKYNTTKMNTGFPTTACIILKMMKLFKKIPGHLVFVDLEKMSAKLDAHEA
jgi:hypothetical protein